MLTHALEGDQTQIRLAERCALDKTTMVVTVDELERAGLAERRPSPTDRRARIIAVTDAGREKVAQADEIVERDLRRRARFAARGRARAFVDGLSRLVGERLATPPACERPVRRRRGR